MDSNGPITIIRVPPDNCTNCARETVPAHRTMAEKGDAVTGWYHCPDCGFMWHTTWRIEPVTPTREG